MKSNSNKSKGSKSSRIFYSFSAVCFAFVNEKTIMEINWSKRQTVVSKLQASMNFYDTFDKFLFFSVTVSILVQFGDSFKTFWLMNH